jgi:hypothetical protein
MSLFADGPPSSIEDLTDQDSGLLDVCRVQQIDASVKLKLAHRELAVQLESLFEQQQTIYSFGYLNSQLTLRNVAVTPTLKMWHTWQALSLVYRDAYFNQLNDRFSAKWNEFRRLGDEARNRLRDLGVGIVWDPLPRPISPTLTPTPATEVGGTFYFTIALLNAAGEQSAPSPVTSIQLADGNAVELQLSNQPANARGWNAYAGTSPGEVYLQNASPISMDSQWTFFPSTAVVSGSVPGNGQAPNMIRALPRLLGRG